jgi:serine/threonine-protein kinase
LPSSVRADLEAAEEALAAGRGADALHLARRTLNVKRSSRAFAIITRAYCAAGDLGNAKANFSSVAGGDRPGVVRACRKSDIDLR